MTNEDLKKLGNDELRALLTHIVTDTAEGVRQGCRIILELELRGVRHGFAKEGAFRWFREIATEKLHPTAALLIYDRATIRALQNLPLDQQAAIAMGEPIPVVEYAPGGKTATVEKKVFQIDTIAIDRVIGPAGVRSVAEQTKMLRDQSAPKPSTEILTSRVRAENGRLVVGRTLVEPNELIEPLLALGFKLVRIETERAVA